MTFTARYLLLVVNTLFCAYLLFAGFMLHGSYSGNVEGTLLFGTALFCVGSAIRFLLALFIGVLDKAYRNTQPTKE